MASSTWPRDILCKSNYTRSMVTRIKMYTFLIGVVGDGIQLGPLGIAATNRPIVLAPGDYEDGEIGGMMIGRGNGSTRRKPATVPPCPTHPTCLPGREPRPPRWEASD
jgi:hypothetical protein